MSRSRAIRSASPARFHAPCGSFRATGRLIRPFATLGEPHRPHAAAAQLANQAIGPDRVARPLAGLDLGDLRVSRQPWGACRGSRCLGTDGPREQIAQPRLQRAYWAPAFPSTGPAATPVDRGRHPAADSTQPSTRVDLEPSTRAATSDISDTASAGRRIQRRERVNADYEGRRSVVNLGSAYWTALDRTQPG